MQVHQLLAQAYKRSRVTAVFPPIQVLPDEVEHSGERAEVVVLLDVKI